MLSLWDRGSIQKRRGLFGRGGGSASFFLTKAETSSARETAPQERKMARWGFEDLRGRPKSAEKGRRGVHGSGARPEERKSAEKRREVGAAG